MSSHLRDIIDATRTALGALDNLHDTGLLPANLQKAASKLDQGWALGAPSSSNTPASRDRDDSTQTHTLVVRLASVVVPLDHKGSYGDALEDADRIAKALMTDIALEALASVSYVGTARVLSASGDYVYSTLTFRALTCVSLHS